MISRHGGYPTRKKATTSTHSLKIATDPAFPLVPYLSPLPLLQLHHLYKKSSQISSFSLVNMQREKLLRLIILKLSKPQANLKSQNEIPESRMEQEESCCPNPQQMAPLDCGISTQSKTRRNNRNRSNPDNIPRKIENTYTDNFYEAIELIVNLGEILNEPDSLNT
ncbi:hypothetical protein NPIL_174901 [Nephila pilipes]|uniref:Uncharacterized protein n=1 Tax=Nephila pilipes TaxID=299642 RepID=A0A8X6TUA8_NEPPI|nr:hypothetical protein NPIL_174901 [Nephila pilipes]